MRKFTPNNIFFIKLIFFTGIIFILTGSVFIVLSVQKETLDDMYKINKYTTYSSTNKKLEQGELFVTKDIKYVSGGVYKVIYRTYTNSKDAKYILNENSTFTITDILGDSYELMKNKTTINNLPISVSESSKDPNTLNVTYFNNTVEIIIPSTKMNNSYVIETYIKLKGREINKKHITTKEAYYSFIPNMQNDKYYKKTKQSYVIDGKAYIVLRKK